MITYNLNGKRAFVTGAASGIGLATATRLARSGCRVAINHLPDDPRGLAAIEALRKQGLDVIGAPGAIGDGNEAEFVEKAIGELGGLDLLVNNAGTPGVNASIPANRLDLITDELWDTVISVNLVGMFRTTRAASSALKAAGGAVVNVASVAALTAKGSSMAYAATKAGVVNLTKHLAIGLAPDVRVNAVAPGAVDSPWQISWTEEQRASSTDQTPLKRWCTPEDLAEMIIFLGFGAPMVTGQTVVVDGGLIL
ncbi:SDR family NAD(P)-dependent oxidoreductase [Devosia sp. A369]